MGEKYLTVTSTRQNRKKKELQPQSVGEHGQKKKEQSNSLPASDAPTPPQPTSPKCSSTLCFSALKTSLLDNSSGYGIEAECWTWCGVEMGGEGAGMNSTRSQRFCCAGGREVIYLFALIAGEGGPEKTI